MAVMKKEQTKDMFPEITVESFSEYKPKKGRKTNLIGFATVTINNVTISGISVMDGEKGIWCSFPSRLGKDKNGEDEYFPVVWLNFGSKDENKLAYDAVAVKIQEFIEQED